MFLMRRMFLSSYQNMNKIVDENPEENTGILWLGDCSAARDKKLLKEKGIKTVITTASGLGISFLPHDGITHRQYNLLDIETQTISHCFDSTFNDIEQGLKNGGSVFIHCAAGISRSATCVIAYLMRKRHIPFREAINFVRSRRPVICPNFGFERQLKQFEVQLGLKPHQTQKISSQHPYNINSNKGQNLNKQGIQNNQNQISNQKGDFQEYPSSPQFGQAQPLITNNNLSNQLGYNKIPPSIQSQAQKNAIKRNQRLQPMSNRNMAEILAQKLSQNNENLQILGIHKLINNNHDNKNISNDNNKKDNENNKSSKNNINNNENKEGQPNNNIQKYPYNFQNSQYNNIGPNIVTYSAKSNLRTSSRGPVPIHSNFQQNQNKGGSNMATSNNFRKRSVKNLYS